MREGYSNEKTAYLPAADNHLHLSAFTIGLFVGRNQHHGTVEISIAETVSVPVQTAFSDSTLAVNGALAAVQPAETTASTENHGLVNINTATQTELMSLPGIGEVLAQRIIDYRTEHGDFHSVGELLNVSGIGEKKLEAIIDLITTGG